MAQTVTYSSPILQGKSVPSCLGSFPPFYHSDLRSRNDRKALGQPVHGPNRSVLQVSLPETHSILSQISGHLPEELTAQGSLVRKRSLMVSLNIPRPGIRGNSGTRRFGAQSPLVYSTTHSCQTRSLSCLPTLPPPPPHSCLSQVS